MKLKLDENLGHRARALLEAAGHDVATVHEQDLCSAADERVARAAADEARCLVTLDIEFGNPLLYRAADYAGIAVLRLPPKPSSEHLENAVKTLIEGLRPGIFGSSKRGGFESTRIPTKIRSIPISSTGSWGRAVLRDLVSATIGFEGLAAEIHKPSKSLHRMLAPRGNPSTDNFFSIVSALQKKTHVKLRVTA